MSDYQPGSFFVVEVTGWAGAAIYFGQFLAQSQSVYGHAGVIVDADGTTVEAAPGGAFVGNISAYAGRALLISDGPVQSWLARRNPPRNLKTSPLPRWERTKRAEIVHQARHLVDVPYSVIDYLALALIHLEKLLTRRPRPTWRLTKWVRNRVRSSGHMICSQLVDAVMAAAGIHLFDDDRLPGDVMPSDLAAWAEDWETTRG